ncbi:MAG: hypothetical protein ACO1O1_13825 [Adhaeribacter sp.]
MHLLRNPLFVAASGAYLANRFLLAWLDLRIYQVPYLNDVLCLPVALTVALSLQQLLFPATARRRLHPAQVVFAFLYFSVFFEGLLPAFSSQYTRDAWDLAAYAAGGFIFYYGCNPKKQAKADAPSATGK